MNETYLLTSYTLSALAAGLAAAAHDVLVGLLVTAGLVTTGRFTPGGLWTRHTDRLATFTTTMRMIAR